MPTRRAPPKPQRRTGVRAAAAEATREAILRAEAPQMADALAFLQAAVTLPAATEQDSISIYDPVPMRMARLANLERAQLLVESPSRPALQQFLPRWREALEQLRTPRQLRWHIEVDPLEC